MSKHDPWIAHNMCPKSQETEISIIRKSNKHGFQSWGWENINDKLIIAIFDGDRDYSIKEHIKNAMKMAKVIAKALNKEKL